MIVTNKSYINITAFGSFIGVGPNWNASILLRGTSAVAENVFHLESCSGTEELSLEDEFTLCAYNGYYLVALDGVICASAREKKDATTFTLHRNFSHGAILCSEETILLYAGQKPVSIPAFEGGKMTQAEVGQKATPVILRQISGREALQPYLGAGEFAVPSFSGAVATRQGEDEWMDEEDLIACEEGLPLGETEAIISGPRSIGNSPQESANEVQDDVFPAQYQIVTEPLQKPLPNEPSPETPKSFELVRDRLEEQLRQSLEVRRSECQLADECNRILDRSERLHESIPRIIKMTEYREQLKQGLVELEKQFPEGALQALDAEVRIVEKMRNCLSLCAALKDDLSASFQETVKESQEIIIKIDALQADLASKRTELLQHRELSETLRSELKPHLEANCTIAKLLPGGQKVIDLLFEARRLLEESDHVLADLIRK